MNERDVTRLPKWAQRWIARLEGDLAVEREKLAEGPDSNTFADPYADAPRPLGTDTRVRFYIDEAARIYVDVSLRGDVLHVHGSDQLAAAPSSSNLLYVKVERWR